MLWFAEEMLDGQHQRADIPAHARTAHKGLLQKRLAGDRCWNVPHVPMMTLLVKGLNWTVAVQFTSPLTCRLENLMKLNRFSVILYSLACGSPAIWCGDHGESDEVGSLVCDTLLIGGWFAGHQPSHLETVENLVKLGHSPVTLCA